MDNDINLGRFAQSLAAKGETDRADCILNAVFESGGSFGRPGALGGELDLEPSSNTRINLFGIMAEGIDDHAAVENWMIKAQAQSSE